MLTGNATYSLLYLYAEFIHIVYQNLIIGSTIQSLTRFSPLL